MPRDPETDSDLDHPDILVNDHEGDNKKLI